MLPIAYVGQSVPDCREWELPNVNAHDIPTSRISQLIPSSGVVMVTYSDYNFKATSQFKSHQVVRQVVNGAREATTASSTPWPVFVACHTSLPNLTPIFMRPGDQIGELIHPWDGRLVKCILPQGHLLEAFSKQQFDGRCRAVSTSSIEFRAPWNATIRSLRVWNISQWPVGKCLDKDNDVPPLKKRHDTANAPTAATSWQPYGIAGGMLLVCAIVVDEEIAEVNIVSRQLYCSRPPQRPPKATKASFGGDTRLEYHKGQPVAIKTLHHPTPFAIQRFIDEILFLDQLKSPFIVTLIGAMWTHPTNVQAVMEYMDMGDLRSYLAKTTLDGFGWQQKLECARSVAEGLFYLHSQNMIHRDLKSRNILLDSVKGTKLADFGLSKEFVYGDTMTVAVGTFRWMAPEMLLFQGYSNSVDIFSFGVVLSKLDTHALP
ncbi:Aste57867_8611 [Aphanomyces stellatus]|uniref:Aste57867_8611 protein n=1 Tax=Aphanomyces stellatus TaxID=120398 RepID=A0A485KKX2_9STRA|nr:hypothetical protein As57867_008577 [Aphanomyces stellatus]VFT85497.1 Aste57867_8611 [Aphanomyces stellatus]